MSSEKNPAPYIRRRAYSKIHVTSWVIYLEKDGFVRCSFKNCNFMAFDVEEMCNHYGFCTGDNVAAKYTCEFCKGSTNDKKKFDLHLARAHNVITQSVSTQLEPQSPESPPERGKPSRVLLQSWGYFFEQYHYIKCQACGYLANNLMEMSRHYSVCKQERDSLLYVCSECKGRTISVNALIWHLERSHRIFRVPTQFNHITKSMVRYWERELEEKGHTVCLHITKSQRDCFYFDQKIWGIVEHSQTCKGPQFMTEKMQCPECRMWTSTDEMLQYHISSGAHMKGNLVSSKPPPEQTKSTTTSVKVRQNPEGDIRIISEIPSTSSSTNTITVRKDIKIKNKKDNSIMILKSVKNDPIYEIRNVNELEKLTNQNEEQVNVENQRIQNVTAQQNLDVCIKQEVEEVEEGCDIVIDYEDASLSMEATISERVMAESVVEVHSTESDNQCISESMNDNNLNLSISTQSNAISKSILKDWSDESSDSLEVECSNVEEGTDEEVVVVESIVSNKNVKGAVVGKEANDSQQQKCQKTQVKEPCLFEDELVSDDDAVFNEEEPKVNSESFVSNIQPNVYATVQLKNYLKRRGSADSASSSSSKRPNTYSKLNVNNQLGGVMKTVGYGRQMRNSSASGTSSDVIKRK